MSRVMKQIDKLYKLLPARASWPCMAHVVVAS